MERGLLLLKSHIESFKRRFVHLQEAASFIEIFFYAKRPDQDYNKQESHQGLTRGRILALGSCIPLRCDRATVIE